MSDEIFEEFKRNEVNTVWCHFLRSKSGQVAKCKHCYKELKCAGGSTGGLHCHLKTLHDIFVLKRTDASISIKHESPAVPEKKSKPNVKTPATPLTSSTTTTAAPIPTPTKKPMYSKTVDDTLPAILSRMTALDGLPFSFFCTSTDIRRLLAAKGFQNIPKTSNTIEKLVVTYSHKVHADVVSELSALKSNGHKASLSLDEWISVRNRRFLNVNVHAQKQVWNLGLIRVNENLPADECIEVIRKKLEVFGLCLDKDIVCITTDGENIIGKVSIKTMDQQLCLASAIQLGVTEVLYRKDPLRVDAKCDSQLPDMDGESESDSDEENYEMMYIHNNDVDSELDDDTSFESGFSVHCSNDLNKNVDFDVKHETIVPLITKIRVVVRLFRKSRTKNDILQKYVKLEFGRKYSLILDTKTCWNSLLVMLERFNKLKSCVQKALIGLSSKISFSEVEYSLLVETISALLPVKLAVLALCRSDANLLTADAALNFMLSSLNALQTDLGSELKETLEQRIQERRTKSSAVLQFLHNGYRTADSRSEYVFQKMQKPVICHYINKVLKRLSPSSLGTSQSDTNDGHNFDGIDDDIMNKSSGSYMKQLLQRAIDKELAGSPTLLDNDYPTKREKDPLAGARKSSSDEFAATIENDVDVLEVVGAKSTILELCYNYLLTIPPSCVEPELVFSSVRPVTRIKSMLNDNTLNSLCFLRAHFIAEKKARALDNLS